MSHLFFALPKMITLRSKQIIFCRKLVKTLHVQIREKKLWKQCESKIDRQTKITDRLKRFYHLVKKNRQNNAWQTKKVKCQNDVLICQIAVWQKKALKIMVKKINNSFQWKMEHNVKCQTRVNYLSNLRLLTVILYNTQHFDDFFHLIKTFQK